VEGVQGGHRSRAETFGVWQARIVSAAAAAIVQAAPGGEAGDLAAALDATAAMIRGTTSSALEITLSATASS